MTVKPQLASSLQKCLRDLPDVSAFSDFTVIVEDFSFPCHKVILNACSVYFQALFRSQMKECQENRVDLHGVTKDAFAVIFDALYKGLDGITMENITEVWQASVQLQIGFMINECEGFVTQEMTVSNCLEFYNHANKLDSQNVKSFSINFLRNNFELCMSDVGLNELPAIDLYNILQNDHLKAPCEDSVVRVILNWIKYTDTSSPVSTESQAGIASESTDDICVNTAIVDRKQYVAKLLSAVRLCLVSNECLRELFDDNIIASSRAARDMIFRAIDYKLSVKHRHGPWPDTAVHRASSENKHSMVFASGAKVYYYLFNNGSTHEYTTLPDPKMATLAVFDNVLYVNNGNSLRIYTRDKIWNCLLEDSYRDLPSRRNVLLSLGSFIYCFDIDYRRLRRINCTYGYHKQWTVCISEIDYVESMIAYKADILLFGTSNGEVITLCFYPGRKKSLRLSPNNPITGPLDGMVSFTYGENVFVLQRNGNLWKIVSGIDFELQCRLWDFDWQLHGSIVYQKQLFVFGNVNCEDKPKDFVWPTSLPGIIEKVRVLQIKSDTPCLPIVLTIDK